MAKFIVIEGLDGCGKATQTKLLKERLNKEGKKVTAISFPNYESDSSAAVKMYLNGEIGKNPSELNPYMCSSFYAIDRFIQFKKEYEQYFMEDDRIIISDRYISANIIHQGAKIDDIKEREKFIKWCYEYECGLCGLPVEDITIMLTLKPEISQRLLLKRYDNDCSKKDIHENSIEYLEKCYERLKNSVKAVNSMPNMHWEMLDCSLGNTGIKSIEQINDEIYIMLSNKLRL